MWIALTVTALLLAVYFFLNAGKESDEPRYITVLRTGDVAQVAVAKSVLDEAGIPYVVKGEALQDLFGVGRLGAGYNFITGPIEVQVHPNHEGEALDLLNPGENPPTDEGGEAA